MENQATQQDSVLSPELTHLSEQVRLLADRCQGDLFALLALLRVLEQLHREISEGSFQAALPNTRHGLYTLLKDIEAEGGWPYIPRAKLHNLMVALVEEETALLPETTEMEA